MKDGVFAAKTALFATVAISIAAVVAGCSPKSDDKPSTALPCDVDAVLATNCRQCHASTPQFGAPMPLTDWEDTQATAVTDPSKKVWQKMQQRIHDPLHPMPAAAPLGTADLATMDAWFAKNAPAGSGSCAAPDGGPPAVTVGVAALPCTPTDTFLAHDMSAPGDTTPYHLAVDAGNDYMCFSYKSPWHGTEEGIAFAPIISDARVLHHWILYTTDTPQEDGKAYGCDGNMPGDLRFLAGWAPGGQNNVLPADVGLELPGPDSFLILQVHYWNVKQLTDVADRSGVAMCTTNSARPNLASVSFLGTLNIDIPAHADSYSTTGTCTPDTDGPITILSASPHMHLLGKSLETDIFPSGDQTQSQRMVRVDPWDFNTQTSHPLTSAGDASKRLVINPGDTLQTTCTYANPGNSPVNFGENTEDEMCFDFVTAYPAGALATTAGKSRRTCIDAK